MSLKGLLMACYADGTPIAVGDIVKSTKNVVASDLEYRVLKVYRKYIDVETRNKEFTYQKVNKDAFVKVA